MSNPDNSSSSSPSSPTTFTRPSLPSLPPATNTLLTRTAIAVPTFPDASTLSFTILARLPIAVPARTALTAILDVSNWGEWNTFIPHADVHSAPTAAFPAELAAEDGWLGAGSKIAMRWNMAGKPRAEIGPVENLRQTPEAVTMLEKIDPGREGGRRGWRLCWKYDGGMDWALRAERVQELVETEDGCEYVTWESFGGWGAMAMRLAVGRQFEERMGDWARDLKRWCEGEDKEGQR